MDLNDHFARRALIHAPTIRGDLRRLPLASDSFDAVWACASLIHLPVDDARAALGELARVARAGAPFCASVKITGQTGWADDPPQGRRWFSIWTPDAFTTAVESVGFSIAEAIGNRGWVSVWARALSPEAGGLRAIRRPGVARPRRSSATMTPASRPDARPVGVSAGTATELLCFAAVVQPQTAQPSLLDSSTRDRLADRYALRLTRVARSLIIVGYGDNGTHSPGAWRWTTGKGMMSEFITHTSWMLGLKW